MYNISLYLIMFIHFLVVCFVVLAPFTNNNYLLLLHVVIVPFIMAHWVINDNTCILTLIEHEIRKKISGGAPVDINESFTARLINPVYDFKANNENCSSMIYGVTTCLWLISILTILYKIKTGSITSYKDFFNKQ